MGKPAFTARAVKGRQDWYALPREAWEAYLKGVPGCLLTGRVVPKGSVLIHRSHLPLLPDYESEWHEANFPHEWHEQGEQFVRTLPSWHEKPRPLQVLDRIFTRSRRGTILAHAMRKGKTFSALLSHEMPEGQIVIVAPLAARQVWLDWIAKRWRGAVSIVEGMTFNPKVLRASPIVLMHYEILDAWRSLGVLRPATVIFDEAHAELTNKKAKRTKAAQVLACQASARVIILSGTPLWNKIEGLYPLLQIVAPGAFGRWYQFAKRYCAGTTTEFGFKANGVSNEDELKVRLSEVMRCEEWSSDEKAQIKRHVEVVELDPSATLELDKAAIAEGVPSTTIGSWAQYRRLLGDIKVARATEIAEKLLDAGKPVVVWTWHQEVAKKIWDQLSRQHRSLRLTGESSADAREATMAIWREGDRPSALIITIGVGQSAIDLSHAAHEIFCEQSWTPAEVAQAEMRPFKPGRELRAYYVVTDHPIDVRIARSLAEKVKIGVKVGVPAADGAVDVIADALSVEVTDDQILEDLRLLFDDQEDWLDD